MNRTQSESLFMLILLTVATVCSAIAIIILYNKYGLTKAYSGFRYLTIMGYGALFLPFLLKKKRVVDERDIMICKRAAKAGYTTAYIVAGILCIFPLIISKQQTVIDVAWLPIAFAIVLASHFFAYLISILIQYARGGKENE